MKIELKDLRVGNHILYRTNDIEEIQEVKFEHLSFLHNDPNGFNLVYSRIPLTEEVLFERYKDNFQDDAYVFGVLRVRKGTALPCYVAATETSFIKELKYLDQLENLICD